MFNDNFLHGKNVYFCPKNDVTEELSKIFVSTGGIFLGFIDKYKKDVDVINDPSLDEASDIVVIYSPMYWREIVDSISISSVYFWVYSGDKGRLVQKDEFSGYQYIMSDAYNNMRAQKDFWESHLREYIVRNNDINCYGHTWGDPDKSNDRLGDYLKIRRILQDKINSHSCVLDLGALGGKWTKYMLAASSIICVDINEYFSSIIKNRYPEFVHKLQFYISTGNELAGILSGSVDFLFCMDTLVRVEKENIISYLQEIHRVLSPTGQAIIHLPNSDMKVCLDMKFTQLTTNEIIDNMDEIFGRDKYSLDSETIIHGTIIYI
ncbi:class I SAM-dependent methyltransferase [Aeromonas hydrophila]|uniref:class I SAM-dependent methyltransferase n=1 Tax=Aeromonas hydrophila TaxID=644 RepID=UPI00249F109E|nr:class I SAM-dependent methyltransferase [Aeromonas hydrophila]WGY32420.1 class I SAM-dependent methyltransferase [Aeromonas hydrophila]